MEPITSAILAVHRATSLASEFFIWSLGSYLPWIAPSASADTSVPT
jgi:hypothetical protein